MSSDFNAADKARRKIQHAGMSLQCPQCHSTQQIEANNSDTSLYCQNCGHQLDSAEQADKTEIRALDSNQHNNTEKSFDTPDQAGNVQPKHEEMPPQRKTVHIWPWLLFMLLIVISSGFYMQKEQWLDNRWLRSNAINLGWPLESRDKDWLIVAESVKPEWIIRNDGSKILIIRGQLKNLLASTLLPAKLEISFYALHQPSQILTTRQLDLTMRPDEQTIKQVPFVRPAIDTMPVSPLSQREFTIVIESLPDGSGDFTLSAKAG